ncbi:phenylalanine--tRNA ligase subunit beta [Ancylobacter dichloromethanicus]|uniref:Phenylalanine--tRNA ligase beta subunit n=1 Tax=Ancylobacter dichloromethanicus TaxID=518825 RepID=A0A9W6J9T0_9HYPH|nr:phenylalanine--tRNA ligase subunit beta [Ancylobacter dichloromethanicus]MBS7556695.1 phenylalanine--tRNA ligase subunit beta [Ancylobacter dichloromethanicus]GLK73546.1 phenylalanine--tRNA ligase beta subunit [Ancylobacter dichloromethanicus]
MKFTLSWLREHLSGDYGLDEVTGALNRIGLEVEGVEDKAAKLKGFTIAYVVSAVQHPNADKLRVCMVDTGAGEPVQVVCGAPNARTGMKSVFSPPGTYIPGKDMTLGIGTIRGVESRGMLCSAAELELSEDHDGILDLPEDAPVGATYVDWIGLDDPVIEIAVTPNRADALGVHGIARDLAAAGLGTLVEDEIAPVAGMFPCPVAVTIADEAPCPAFALRLVRGVTNGPSPDWLQAKLRAIGLRPINALVDVTNLLTFDQNRPLHVFDAAKVRGDLVVRRAREGESLLALDGKTYALDAGMCVIADDRGVESLAGVMGGEESGCDEATTDVLVESALWEPINIAQTGRKLGLNSDARFRFERGIDPAFTLPGLELATKLILDLCGGEPSEVVLAGTIPDTTRAIDFPLALTEKLTGLVADEAEQVAILCRLGFAVEGAAGTVAVTPPSWRGDIEGKADLVEEVIRIAGLDRVPSLPFPRDETARKPVLTTLQLRTRKAKRALAARGLVEAVTWSFVPKAQAELFGGGQNELALANPIAADLSDMRPSLLPGLIRAAQANADRGLGDVALFEVGQVFRGDRPQDQFIAATGLRRATAKPAGAGRHWSGKSGAVDAFDAKADALALLAACGAPVANLQISTDAPGWFHPGRSGTFRLGPNVIGHFGELHPSVLEALDCDGALVGFELLLDRIPAPKAKPTRVKPLLELAAFQPVERDFAFVVARGVAAGDMVKAAAGVDRKLITAVNVFDLYEGENLKAPGIDAEAKSVALSVTLQPREKTLTDAEIEAVASKIVAEVTKKTGATLRG